MIYKDRIDAAKQLVKLLLIYKNCKDAIILALPRGGVVLGDIIAKDLNLKLDIIISKKISSSISKELAIGGICENSIFLNEELINDLKMSEAFLKKEIEEKKKEILERKKLYNKNKTPLKLKNKIVILVDDGIATGATIIAAVDAIKKMLAKKIIIAVPVAPYTTIETLRKLADEIICPYTPDDFYAIGQFYDNFEEITDKMVLDILNDYAKTNPNHKK
jgi:putative phosphoribosyl transferase